MGKIKILKGKNFNEINELEEDIYPVTSTKSVYDTNNKDLDSIINSILNNIKTNTNSINSINTSIGNKKDDFDPNGSIYAQLNYLKSSTKSRTYNLNKILELNTESPDRDIQLAFSPYGMSTIVAPEVGSILIKDKGTIYPMDGEYYLVTYSVSNKGGFKISFENSFDGYDISILYEAFKYKVEYIRKTTGSSRIKIGRINKLLTDSTNKDTPITVEGITGEDVYNALHGEILLVLTGDASMVTETAIISGLRKTPQGGDKPYGFFSMVTYQGDYKGYIVSFEIGSSVDIIISEVQSTTSGISDAPSDDKLYGRKNASWTEITASGEGITDAPSDSKTYARKDGNWENITYTLNKAGGTRLSITGKLINGIDLSTDYTIGGWESLLEGEIIILKSTYNEEFTCTSWQKQDNGNIWISLVGVSKDYPNKIINLFGELVGTPGNAKLTTKLVEPGAISDDVINFTDNSKGITFLAGTDGFSSSVDAIENEVSFNIPSISGQNIINNKGSNDNKFIIPVATQSSAGVMSMEDKIKLDNITSGNSGNKYRLLSINDLTVDSLGEDIYGAFTPISSGEFLLPTVGDLLIDEENNMYANILYTYKTEVSDEGGYTIIYLINDVFTNKNLIRSINIGGATYNKEDIKVLSINDYNLDYPSNIPSYLENIRDTNSCPFWVDLLYSSDLGKVVALYKDEVAQANEKSKILVSDDGVNWNILRKFNNTAVNGLTGDSCFGLCYDKDNIPYVLTIKYGSDTIRRNMKVPLTMNSAASIESQGNPYKYVKSGVSNPTVIPTGPILKGDTPNLYYFTGYWRANNTYGVSNIWRGIALFSLDTTDPQTDDVNFITNIVDFTTAPGTPTGIDSKAVFINECSHTQIGSNIFTAIRCVGNIASEYNKGFYIYNWDINDPSTLNYTDVWKAIGNSSGSTTKNAVFVNTSDFTSGGHLKGVLPRITYFYYKGNVYLLIVMYVRCNNTGTEVSQLYYSTIKLGNLDKDSINNAFKRLSLTWHKLGEAMKTGDSGSPEGGNFGICNKDNKIYIICTNSSKGRNTQKIVLDPTKDIIIN